MITTRARVLRHLRPGLFGLTAALLMMSLPAARADVLGLYAGGAFGQGRIDTGNLGTPATNTGSFTENHSAYKLIAGTRILSIVGAEIEYLDLGHPSGGLSSTSFVGSADVKIRGGGAFGIVYLPVPVVSLYPKAGLTGLQATYNVTGVLSGVGACAINNPNCALVSQHNGATNTSFAAGAGAQAKFGSVAVRAEYERFSAAGGSPGLASLGVVWTFF